MFWFISKITTSSIIYISTITCHDTVLKQPDYKRLLNQEAQFSEKKNCAE
jgi:hypothetical protein